MSEARPRLITRRRVLGLFGVAGVGLLGARIALPRIWRPGPPRPLDSGSQAFVDGCLAGLDRSAIWDVHVHIVGTGSGGTGTRFNPEFASQAHPYKRLQFELYMGASGITDPEQADQQYLARLLELQRLGNPRGKLLALAFDRFFDADGVEDPVHTNFYTPNEYVLQLARQHEAIVPCGSIHPYRADAVDRLHELAEAGIVAVKWLPPAMGIDPASPRCDAFYAALEQTGVYLLSHAGTEQAVDAADLQALGNPLRLRRALDAGVKVIVAHCGSLGDNEDLDRPAAGRVDNVDLFLRLMREERYEHDLLADISAMTFVNRAGRPLRAILEATDIHHRLLYGSDYPVLAVEPVLSTAWLQLKGFLTADERRACNAVLDANPLLGDLVVKRCVAGRDGQRFGDPVFDTARWFPAAG